MFDLQLVAKKGQGQPKVIIRIILVIHEYPIIHIIFLGSAGSKEEDF